MQAGHTWGEVDELISGLEGAADQDFQSYLEQSSRWSEAAKRLAKDFVEGYHAAPAGRIGTGALALAEQASARDEADRHFRITPGYSALVDWFARTLAAHRAEVHLKAVVKTVRWKPGAIEVEAETPDGTRRFNTTQAVITLPLGVLQASDAGAARFDPELAEK